MATHWDRLDSNGKSNGNGDSNVKLAEAHTTATLALPAVPRLPRAAATAQPRRRRAEEERRTPSGVAHPHATAAAPLAELTTPPPSLPTVLPPPQGSGSAVVRAALQGHSATPAPPLQAPPLAPSSAAAAVTAAESCVQGHQQEQGTVAAVAAVEEALSSLRMSGSRGAVWRVRCVVLLCALQWSVTAMLTLVGLFTEAPSHPTLSSSSLANTASVSVSGTRGNTAAHSVAEEWGAGELGAMQLQGLSSIFFLGWLGGAGVMGYAADKHGRLSTLQLCTTLMPLAALALPLAPTFEAYLVAKALCGFVNGGFNLVAYVLANEVSTPHYLAVHVDGTAAHIFNLCIRNPFSISVHESVAVPLSSWCMLS